MVSFESSKRQRKSDTNHVKERNIKTIQWLRRAGEGPKDPAPGRHRMVGNRPRETPRTRNARSKTTSTREMHALASISITSPAFLPRVFACIGFKTRASLPFFTTRKRTQKTRASPSPLARVRANHVRSIPNENRAFDAHSIGKKE